VNVGEHDLRLVPVGDAAGVVEGALGEGLKIYRDEEAAEADVGSFRGCECGGSSSGHGSLPILPGFGALLGRKLQLQTR
jgi:hypothetical protein